jgi:uncharacterized protein YndB with AHSA1/START domain
MRTVDLERTIQAPIDDVFEWLTDATNFQRAPLIIRRVTLVRPGNIAEHGVGAVRLLVTPLLRITEEIVEYEPPYRMRYRVLHSVPPLRYQAGCMTFEATDSGTHVRWHSEFEVGASVFGAAMTLVFVPFLRWGNNLLLDTAERELRRG